jgi:hypothetical protein
VSITGSANGNIYVKSSSGTNLLYLGADGGNGYISLKDSGGTNVLVASVANSGGKISVRNTSGTEVAALGLDSNGFGMAQVGKSIIAHSSYGGRIQLINSSDEVRAQMSCDTYGGSITLYDAAGNTRINLSNGVFVYSGGNIQLSLGAHSGHGGILSLYDTSGNYSTLTKSILEKLIRIQDYGTVSESSGTANGVTFTFQKIGRIMFVQSSGSPTTAIPTNGYCAETFQLAAEYRPADAVNRYVAIRPGTNMVVEITTAGVMRFGYAGTATTSPVRCSFSYVTAS